MYGDDVLHEVRRHPHLQQIKGDMRDRAVVDRAMRGCDAVIHLACISNDPSFELNPDLGKSINYDAFFTLVASAKAAGVRRFVYLSGAGAGQGRPQPWFQAKDRAEAAIRESGLEHAILRPSWIYGPRDRSMNRFVAFCRYLPVVPVIGDGKTRVEPVYVKDVARCVAEAAVREDCKDKVFELGGPERLTMDEIIRTVQALLAGSRPFPLELLARLTGQPLLHHPAPLMKLLVRPLQLLPEPILSPGAIDFVLQEAPVDPKPALEYFGGPFRSLREGLREYLP